MQDDPIRDGEGLDVRDVDIPYSDKFHLHQVNAGRAGGKARTEAKREATRRNLEKARLSRWKGREAAKEAAAAIRALGGLGGLQTETWGEAVRVGSESVTSPVAVQGPGDYNARGDQPACSPDEPEHGASNNGNDPGQRKQEP